MADAKTLKTTFERNRELLTIKPTKGQYTTTTKVRLYNGTTCEIEHKHWTFKADVGKTEGGNDKGPGPGILERAALGSCLAIGYSKWAAHLDVPIDKLEVDVIGDVDSRGAYGIDDVTPGYKSLIYKVMIESPAKEKAIHEVIEKADAHSPVLNSFTRAIPVDRQVVITLKKDKHDRPMEV